jgi:tRNA (guanine-N7-)-methyltransferase
MIIRPGRLSLPIDEVSLFGRSAPLALEVGFGDGRYLSHLGKARPDWNLLGVEVSMGSMWRAYRRLLRDGVGNARLFHGDARFVVRDVIAPGTLQVLYVNFPDPWPRKRHLSNRLLQRPFFELAADRLAPGGMVSLTTDHGEYLEFAVSEAEKVSCLAIERKPPGDEVLQTKYALKWREQRKEIHHVEFRKIADGPRVPAQIEKIEMQHAVLEGRLSDVKTFEKQVRPFEGGHVIVLDAFRALGGDGLLFKVLVEETDLRQEVLVQAWQRDNEVYVALEPFGDPLGTKGLRTAVATVAGWLTDQGLTLRDSWI